MSANRLPLLPKIAWGSPSGGYTARVEEREREREREIISRSEMCTSVRVILSVAFL